MSSLATRGSARLLCLCAALAAAAAVGSLAISPGRSADRPAIAVHYAYGTPRAFVVEGRVAEEHTGRETQVADSWLVNLWRTLRGLRTEEAAGVRLRAIFGGRDFPLKSDEEGYFELRADTPSGVQPGWSRVRIEAEDGSAGAEAPLLVVPPENTLGIISDFDDTIVVSEVPDRSRLARHTLLENYLQRRAVPGMADLYRSVAARNPRPVETVVIYLTGSPRQIQPGVEAFLEHNGFPRGAVVAKKVTDGDGGDPLLDQERYKTARIERILADLAPVRFVFSGDDGERDPEVYQAVRARHPSRVEAVWIRGASPDPARPRYPGQVPPPVAGVTATTR